MPSRLAVRIHRASIQRFFARFLEYGYCVFLAQGKPCVNALKLENYRELGTMAYNIDYT